MKKKHRIIKWTGIILAILLVVATVSGAIWINKTYKPNEEAKNVLAGTSKVKVTKDNYIEFMPTDKEPETGLIFYPGGLVEPEAYAPLCEKIAEKGYLVVIAPMKWNLAILSPNEAKGVQEKYPSIKTWAIGGHSLGGVMACKYASNHDTIKGIILYAAYPQSDEIEASDINVLSMYGSLDGVADLNKVKNAKLPKNAEFKEIPGGNHSYFGSYGLQKGDNETTIASNEQLNIAANNTAEFLRNLK